MYVQGVSTAAVGGATVAVLPDTGVYRPLFVLGATLVAMGVIMLVVSSISSIKKLTASSNK